VTYLIRGAIFRPKYTTSLSVGLSLAELIDMYHTHKATMWHDKVYALLGMSSDDPNTAGLLPDYAVPWEKLFQRLIKYILFEGVSVETWGEREIAIIKSKCCILGQISSVKSDSVRFDRQYVEVVFNNEPWSLEYMREYGSRWILQASAKPVQKHDFVCLLQGASKPTIIRRQKDHFAIIMIGATLWRYAQTESGHLNPQNALPLTQSFSREFLLVWNWEESQKISQDRVKYESSTEINTLVPEYLKTASDKAARSYDVVLVLGDSQEYKEAQKRLQEEIKSRETTFGKEDLNTLALTERLAMIHKNQRQWTEAKDLLLELIKIRQRVQGIDHQDTLGSTANLASIYIDQVYRNSELEKVKASLLERIRDNVKITEIDVALIASLASKDMMALLLGLRRDNVPVTREVVNAAAGNSKSGKEVMALLLDQRGSEVKITEEVVTIAAGNHYISKEIMQLLLNQRGSEFKITEKVIRAAAWNEGSGKEVIELLLNQRGSEVKITEEVVIAAAKNRYQGKDVIAILLSQRGSEVKITEEVVAIAAGKNMALLLDQRSDGIIVSPRLVQTFASSFDVIGMEILLTKYGSEVKITEAVVTAAVGNFPHREKMLVLLLNQRSSEVKITEEVVTAIAKASWKMETMMALLLDQRSDGIIVSPRLVQTFASSFDVLGMKILLTQYGSEVKITEEVVMAAAENMHYSKNMLELLFNQRGSEFKISEKVVTAAARNDVSGGKVIALLLNQRGSEFKITEEIVLAAAKNTGQGEEIMELLLDQRGSEVKVTQEVVIAAAGNEWNGKQVIELLLNRRSSEVGEVKITEEAVTAAAGNHYGGEVIELLFNHCSAEFKITEEMVVIAARNRYSGRKVIEVFLNQRGYGFNITEAVVQAAASNKEIGEEVMALLSDQFDIVGYSEV
jgi:hypothetical protein